MTEYEYNLTFTVTKYQEVSYETQKHTNKKTIDFLFLNFMKELVEQEVQEMSCYVSEKEKIN